MSLPDSWDTIVKPYKTRIVEATIGQQAVARSADDDTDNFSDPDEATTPMMTHIVSEDEGWRLASYAVRRLEAWGSDEK